MIYILILIGIGVVTFTITWTIWLLRNIVLSRNKKTVCIVVLGDLGRSPRMQYHGLSFTKEGYSVDIIAYSGSEPLQELQSHAAVKIHYLRSLPKWHNQMPQLVRYIMKTLWQSANLLWILFTEINCNYLVLQNPPAIPTMPICWLYCRIVYTHFIIDWHNYAYSIMSMTVGQKHALVKITMFVESFFGVRADTNFCVSHAMKEDLHERWNIEANVLYDKPSKEFRPIDLSEKHQLLVKLSDIHEEFGYDVPKTSALTECLPNGEIRLRSQRPALIISSTSWTEDEDFSILFNALKHYESACSNGNINLPNLICVITGKGPLKNFWNAIIKLKKWEHVKIVTPWLTNEDYPKLLATADLGICLHTSSSGLDLPMKVVDMYGCILPVFAYNFQCLHELVKDDKNGYVFNNDQELAAKLTTWFVNFPNNHEQILKNQEFRREIEEYQKNRWDKNWLNVVPNQLK